MREESKQNKRFDDQVHSAVYFRIILESHQIFIVVYRRVY